MEYVSFLQEVNSTNKILKNYIDGYRNASSVSERERWLNDGEVIDNLRRFKDKLTSYIETLENNTFEPVTLRTGIILTKEGVLTDTKINIDRMNKIINGEQDAWGGNRRKQTRRNKRRKQTIRNKRRKQTRRNNRRK